MEDMEAPDISVGELLPLEELEQNPRLAINVLDYCLYTCMTAEATDDPRFRESWLELDEQWMRVQRAIPLKEAKRLIAETTDYEEYMRLQRWAGKRGRPSTLRHTAIMALVRKIYFGETWREVTKRLCTCGAIHTPARLAKKCQPKLEAEVRILKRLLRDCNVGFPETPRVFDRYPTV